MKFRSENLLENGNKNRRNLPCGELLLSLIRTRSFGEKQSSSSFLQRDRDVEYSNCERYKSQEDMMRMK